MKSPKSKLRLVQERRNEVSQHSNDVRGVGDQELFQNTGIKMHLFVEGTLPAQETSRLVQKYGIHAEWNSTHSHIHFTVEPHQIGQHKMDALKLLVCAVEVLHMHSHVHACLFHHNDLKEVMHKKSKTKNPMPLPDTQANDLLKSSKSQHSCLVLDSWVLQAAQQSELISAHSNSSHKETHQGNEFSHWTAKHVESWHQTLEQHSKNAETTDANDHSNVRSFRKTG